jgi:hypothetical protein
MGHSILSWPLPPQPGEPRQRTSPPALVRGEVERQPGARQRVDGRRKLDLQGFVGAQGQRHRRIAVRALGCRGDVEDSVGGARLLVGRTQPGRAQAWKIATIRRTHVRRAHLRHAPPPDALD